MHYKSSKNKKEYRILLCKQLSESLYNYAHYQFGCATNGQFMVLTPVKSNIGKTILDTLNELCKYSDEETIFKAVQNMRFLFSGDDEFVNNLSMNIFIYTHFEGFAGILYDGSPLLKQVSKELLGSEILKSCEKILNFSKDTISINLCVQVKK